MTWLLLIVSIGAIAIAYSRGRRKGERRRLIEQRYDAERATRAAFRACAENPSELAHMRWLHTSQELERIQALLDGDVQKAYEVEERNEKLLRHIQNTEVETPVWFERLMLASGVTNAVAVMQ